MPFDAYSPCPGGRDKKIKFCCPHLLDELNEIDKMLQAQQFAACLKHVEKLQEKNEDCACLETTKVMLLELLQRPEEALAVAEKLAAREPDNALAWGQLATTRALAANGPAAMEAWLTSVEKCPEDTLPSETFAAMEVITQRLLSEGELLPALALSRYHDLALNETTPNSMWLQLQRTPNVPALLKTIPFFKDCPEGVSWKADYDAGLELLERLRWRLALEKLEGVLDRADEFPWVWQAVGMLRAWLLNRDGCIEAYRKLAASEIDVDDAVEARLFTLLLEEDPLGDQVDVQAVTYEIKDFDLANESLLSWDHAITAPINPRAWDVEEGGPPPRNAFALFDGPEPDDGEPLDAEKLPQALSNCLLFGRETDRPARLAFLELPSNRREKVEALLKEKLGDAMGDAIEEETITQTSLTFQRLRPRWRTPSNPTREQVEALTFQYKNRFLLETWPSEAVPALDGKTPTEAAADDAKKVDVLAVILLLENWCEETLGEFDFNTLREKLGLPTAGEIEPVDRDAAMRLSPIRLRRLPVEKLDDDALSAVFARAATIEDTTTARRAAMVIVDRESFKTNQLRLQAYHALATSSTAPDEVFDWVAKAKAACIEMQLSCAQFDLFEIPLRLQNGQPDEAGALIQHLQTAHIREPGVADALMRTLVALGILRPDGTPAMPPQGAPDPVEQGGGGLWTPDGGAPRDPGQEGGGGSKLWTPDM